MFDYNLIIVGGGASGCMAAIQAARLGLKVALFERLDKLLAKVRASGGGRCNLTNTLDQKDFIKRFGRDGKFIIPALQAFDSQKLREFFAEIGVETVAHDGFRVFPAGHDSQLVNHALQQQLQHPAIKVFTGSLVDGLIVENGKVLGISCGREKHFSDTVILASGGRGYPALGGSDSGLKMAAQAGHSIVGPFPAMLPLRCRETWVEKCRADTIGKAKISIDLDGYRKFSATGDLIFTNDGIRGPVVLDFAREITPLLEKFTEVPLLLDLCGGLNEEQILQKIKKLSFENEKDGIAAIISRFLPVELAKVMCQLAQADENLRFSKLAGQTRERLLKILVATPVTVVGHAGFEHAMVTRGGVSLKEIDPRTLASRLVQGLFFCGEMVDLDGPCGGFNLQWAFSSGFLAARSVGNYISAEKKSAEPGQF
ncbi:MAG: NAD(P)/FAD-dependent oxidoreductase [Candidatus Rifleibacteriota bacterium]